MHDYSSSAAFCQALKSIADQLTSLGHPVSDERLVLQLIAGLNDEFDTVVTFIQQSQPLPSFQNARSMVALEETRRNNARKSGPSPSNTVLVTTDPAVTDVPPVYHQQPTTAHRGGRQGGRPHRGRGGRSHRGGRASHLSHTVFEDGDHLDEVQ
ncbi:uncharacterized protein LOC104905151 [Beta vulgaris subsp. vulgaris]|uniref:uncharacterized protein LOC104905151 n=1 Tax=Beta vulgaris subsp. vulgaris TaxID=3555 RepID=UPI00053F747F|nr:uncharacterized protein LOC104905151 [Beta vulgaris subsp. vulgaris]